MKSNPGKIPDLSFLIMCREQEKATGNQGPL